MSHNLTHGAIQAMYNGGKVDGPVVQVIDLKRLQAPNPSTGAVQERFRLVISDGSHFQQAMLATQLNHLARDNAIQLHSIVRLQEFICNAVHGRKVVIILALDVLGGPLDSKIGNPVNIETNTQQPAATTAPQAAPAPAPAPVQQQQQFKQSPASTPQNQPSRPAAPQQNFQQQPYKQENHSVPNRAPQSYGNPSLVNRPPTGQKVDESMVQPIASITTFNNKFTVKGRVTAKSDIRRFSNAKGEGKLFSIDLLDAEGGEIRMTMFNDLVDKYHPMIELDKVYIVSKGTVKIADRRYSAVKNEYEVTLNSDSNIIPCGDDSNIQRLRFEIVPILSIEQQAVDSSIDVVGVVCKVGDVSSITGKTTGKQFSKRSLTLLDSSNATIELTLWGGLAENFTGAETDVVIAKSVRVGTYQNGKVLSTTNTSSLVVNADHPAVHSLRGWYENAAQSAPRVNLSSVQTQGQSGSRANDERKTLSQIKDENLGTGEKPDYFTSRGYVMFIKQDGVMYYPACPTEGCNKKVTQSNGVYSCEKCGREYDRPEHRYILSLVLCDHTSSQWVSAYNDVGPAIMGDVADRIAEMKLAGDEKSLNDLVKAASYRPYVFRMMAKTETYQDEAKVKCQIRQINPINYAHESRLLLDDIRRLRQHM